MDTKQLLDFIVMAKAAAYVGDGSSVSSSRKGSHDLKWSDGDWSYRDSYFGGTDFLGQEIIWFRDQPVWAMNYYGYILSPQLIDAERAGKTIKGALRAMYQEGRFLGGFSWVGEYGTYVDRNEGDACHFHGRETITVEGVEAYALDYFGGLVKS